MSDKQPGGKPHEIVMPQLGLSMDSGQIVQWLKKTGDSVRQGEILLEIESDKSVVEVEAVANGSLQILLGPEAGPVKVGEVIGYVLAEGQAQVRAFAPATPALVATAVEPSTSPRLAGEPPAALAPGDGHRRLPSTPAARRRAAELGVDWRLASPSGLRGQIREPDVLALAVETVKSSPIPSVAAEIAISPVARRLAEATGVDLEALALANPGKRLERADVEQALRQVATGSQAAPSSGLQPPASPAQPGSATQPAWPLDEIHGSLPARREPVTLLRRMVAERMAGSVHVGAAVTLTTKSDATELVRLRATLKQKAALAADGDTAAPGRSVIQPVPSYNILIAALTSRALVEHPFLNATLDGEEVIIWEIVNMGLAVDTPRGLVVPVLRDVAAKALAELAAEAEELLPRAAAGKARPDELSGGTFTITNLGAQDIDFFTPIINPPQCAVLGVGRLNKEWVVLDDDQPAARTMLPLSLTFDHRLVDGAPAARFLQRVKQFVEQPYLWLR